jgi:hypothetical protein
VVVGGLSNREFLEAHARPGRVGLSGGTTLVDRAIRRAESRLDRDGEWSRWSHAFLFEGRRADGCHWLLESDLQVHRRHVSLGVQENRVDKYHDEALYPWLAVLDFGLTGEQAGLLLREGLDLVAARTRYSLRELLGSYVAMRLPRLRGEANLLERRQSLYCSAFVQHVFRRIGVDLAPGVHVKNTAPEDISRSPRPHDAWVLERDVEDKRLSNLGERIRRRVRGDRAR